MHGLWILTVREIWGLPHTKAALRMPTVSKGVISPCGKTILVADPCLKFGMTETQHVDRMVFRPACPDPSAGPQRRYLAPGNDSGKHFREQQPS